MGSVLRGIAWTALAGVLSGNCMLPMKFCRRWKWENVWLVFSLVSLAVLPLLLAGLTVHRLTDVYRAATTDALLLTFLLGMGWGVAQVLFGLSVTRLGLGLTYAIVVGLGALLGTVVPLFSGVLAHLDAAKRVELAAGVCGMVAGIAISGFAGWKKESHGRTQGAAMGAAKSTSYGKPVALAVLCGVMAPMLNFAFVAGQPIAASAMACGNAPFAAGFAVWPIALLGGLVPNLVYAVWLLQTRKTWSVFVGGAADGGLAVGMAVLWMSAFAVYGVGANVLGPLGLSVGWGLMQVFMIGTATCAGIWTGEWREAPPAALRYRNAGIGALLAATLLLAMVNA